MDPAPLSQARLRLRRARTSATPPRLRIAVWGLVVGVGTGLWVATVRIHQQLARPSPIARSVPFDLRWLSTDDAIEGLEALPEPRPGTVRRGQTLLRVFEDLGLSSKAAWAAAKASSEHLDPRSLRAGDPFSAYLGPDQTLERVVFRVRDRGRLEVRRADLGWQSEWYPYRISRSQGRVNGELVGALESSIRTAGAPGSVAYRLADVFQWDLDFSRDLRNGDSFSVLFEEVYLDGRLQRVEAVIAAVYENRGHLLEAHRFGQEGGYYDGQGRPLRKQFLRSPLEFSRVTSRFSNRRFHPVLRQYRPHYGVDYGAPTGTPVRVTAGGVVASVGWSNGGGKRVQVRHPNGYLTAYLHLSGYPPGIRSGARVRQGQVVGYVGATGLATAPHLDYRVQKNGRWIDPMRIRNEPAPPLGGEQLAEFFSVRDGNRTRLARESAEAERTARPEGLDRSAHALTEGRGDSARASSVAGPVAGRPTAPARE